MTKQISNLLAGIWDFVTEKLLVKTIERLGIPGTVTFIGALYALNALNQVDYKIEPQKGYVFILSSLLLLLFSGWIYHLNSKEKTSIVHGALNSLTQVFQRIPEQVDKTRNGEEIEKLMGALKDYPDKIIQLIKDTETKT
ncbi:MAG: hypothetical protein AAB486_02935 [Patescibacteria group bacterium]